MQYDASEYVVCSSIVCSVVCSIVCNVVVCILVGSWWGVMKGIKSDEPRLNLSGSWHRGHSHTYSPWFDS